MQRQSPAGYTKYLLLASDIVVTLITGGILIAIAELLIGRHTFQAAYPSWIKSHSLLFGLNAVLFWLDGHYTQRRLFWDEMHSIIKLIALTAIIDAAFIDPGFILAHTIIWTCVMLAIPMGRGIVKASLNYAGLWSYPAVIVGTGRNAIDTYAALRKEAGLGYRVVAFVNAEPPTTIDHLKLNGTRIEVFPFASEAARKLFALDPAIFVALETAQDENINMVVKHFRNSNNRLHVVPSLRGLPLVGTEITTLFSHELILISPRNNLGRSRFRAIKRAFDLVVSALLMILLSPLFAFLCMRVKSDSAGPIFYGHERIGQNGKTFKCYKFRTMVENAADILKGHLDAHPEAKAEWDRDFKLRNDPRITLIGHFLRKFSLDELPQLWNVFKGEMSLVGPRPIVTAELARYKTDRDYYLETPPGVTGLWQVSGRSDADYGQRIAYDVWYVRNWSLWLDVVILFKTVPAVFARKGAY